VQCLSRCPTIQCLVESNLLCQRSSSRLTYEPRRQTKEQNASSFHSTFSTVLHVLCGRREMAPTTFSSYRLYLAVALMLLPLAASLKTPFNVYVACSGGVGLCRQRSPASELSSSGRGPTAAAGQPDPVACAFLAQMHQTARRWANSIGRPGFYNTKFASSHSCLSP
jgi:hypothetical protein